ncbi:hypothetical protein CDEST_01165 [Colletotrichum destructivum]|uniref:Uncharacterized protein n=1 Tax=Colletotrichum destructivum TaxID=34406 RepID=A0AAX4HZ85_9PEZI|nr:hypothetical protein CDEST_01165 [Colletotrichum destructivum]
MTGVVDRRRVIRMLASLAQSQADHLRRDRILAANANRRRSQPAGGRPAPQKPDRRRNSPAAGGRAWVTGSRAPARTLDPSGSILSSSPPIATATLGIDRVVTSHGMRSSKKGVTPPSETQPPPSASPG